MKSITKLLRLIPVAAVVALSSGTVSANQIVLEGSDATSFHGDELERGPIFRTGKLMILYQLTRSFHETYSPSYFSRRV